MSAAGIGRPVDEFDLLESEAADLGLAWAGRPAVARTATVLDDGRAVSAIAWSDRPDVVLLHGGAQNAHTWDGVALLLDRPLLALDLPGHGHSDWRADIDYSVDALADDLAQAVPALAATPVVLVGMSLGGMVGLRFAAAYPALVRGLALVDITPSHETTSDTALEFFREETFASFDELVGHASSLSGKTDDAARRSVLHNARQRPDGRWEWRHHFAHGIDPRSSYTPLWDSLAALRIPVMLVRGGRSPIVTDADVDTFLTLQPSAAVHLVPGAGHSVQRSQPRALAALVQDFLATVASG